MPADEPAAPPALVDQLARADVKARLFGAPAESARVGRFAVLRRIGAGGMGVVYAAYDEELDRKVAIKLVLPGRDDPDIRARSRREAQALARLSHPNVVQVYEVGEYDGQVYLAMEYIQGQTLRAWQSSTPRTWREVVAMYLQVGRGLAAAHARGLVHRDFKPDNVLVGDDDQRPRVLDFGLARVRTRDPEPVAPPTPFTTPASSQSFNNSPPTPSHPDLSPRPGTNPTPPSAGPAPHAPTLHATPHHLSQGTASLAPTLHATPHHLSQGPAPFAPTLPHHLSQGPAPLAPTLHATPDHLSQGPAPSDPLPPTLHATPPHLSQGPAPSDPLPPTLHATPPDLSPRPASSPDPREPDALGATAFASPPPGVDESRLTVPGAVLGTPAYMAPEQLAGGEADARSDLFSFCVALYEALLRIRPFAGDRSDTLLAAVERGEIVRPERPPDVPAWLLRIVERGLSADPAARWAGMDPLLAALARDPTRWRRRLAFIALAITILVAGVLALLEVRDRQRILEVAVQQTRAAEAEAELRRARLAADREQQRGEARRLAIEAGLAADADPVLHLLLAVAAVRIHSDAGDPPIPEATQALRNALDNVTSTPFVPADTTAPHVLDAVAESRDGRWLAAGDRNGAVTLWSTADPRRPLTLLPADGRPVLSLDFDPETTRLAATRQEPGGPHVWTLPATPSPVPSDISTKPVPEDTPASPVPEDTPASPTPEDTPTSPAPEDTPTSPVPRDTSTTPVPGGTSVPRPAATSAPPPPAPPVRWDSPVPDLRDLAWSPDGAALLARAGDLAVVLRPAGALVLRGHTAPVRRAVWSPDGATILTASADHTARLWPARGGPARVVRLTAPLWSAVFSPDGREFAVALADHTAARIPARGGPPRRLRGHTAPVQSVAYVDPERLLTVAADDTARLWDADASSTRIDLPGHRDVLGGVRVAPGGDLLLGTPSGGAAWLWQRSRPGSPLVLHGHAGSVVTARFSPDGRRVLTGSADGTARRWHIDDDPAVLRGHDAGIEHASFAGDARRVLTAAMDGTVRVWPRDGRPPVVLTGHREGSSVLAAFSPDGARLATAASDGLARLWALDAAVPALVATLPDESDREPALTALAWHPHGDRLALGTDDGRIHLVHASPSRPVRTDILAAAAGSIDALAVSPDGARLAAAGADAVVRVWRLAEPPVLEASHTGHSKPVRDLLWLADRLVSVGDATVRLWSPDQVLSGHLGEISRVRLHPDGRTLLTASADGTARVWPPGAAPEVLAGHTGAVWLAEWSPDGHAILTAADDGTARLWQRDSDAWRATLLPQAGAPGDADPTLWTGGFSPDGRLALVAGADAIARVHLVPLADQLAEACRRAGRDLDPAAWLRSMGDRPRRPICPPP